MRTIVQSVVLVIGLAACDQPADTAADTGAARESAPATEPSTPAATQLQPSVEPSVEPSPHFVTADQVDTTTTGEGEGPYRFTARWHTQRIDNWTKQLADLRGRPDLRYLEIGVFEGRSMVWMFEQVLTDPSSRATAIDVFMDDYQQTFDANVRASPAGDRVTKLVGRSQDLLRTLEPDSFDVIYVDGSHTADDVLADAVLAWPLLRVGGMMIFDDYAWNGRPTGSALPLELLPKLAIDAFITAYRNEIEVVDHGYQVFLRRKLNPCPVKDYCSPIGQYNYLWRALELRRQADDTLVELAPEERELIELIAKSKRIGEVGFHLDPRFVASPAYVALATRLELDLVKPPEPERAD